MISRVVKIAGLFIIFLSAVGVFAYLTLTLIIKGEDTVIVPDLNGREVVYVLKILTDLGLNTKVGGSEYSDVVPTNHVIYQAPEPGTEIKKGRDIRIIVSRGSRTILMPNLIGFSAQKARITIDENGLCQGNLSFTYNDRIMKDKIIAQFPMSGEMIKRAECIDLLMSMGLRPATFKMPDLRGKPVEEAILLIEDNNLLLGDITPVFDKDKPMNKIARQEPRSGQRVVEGTIVNLEANRRPEKDEGRYLGDSGGLSLFKYRHEYGFLKKRIRIRLNWFGVSNDLFDEFMRPGEELWVLIPRDHDVSVFLYKDNELAESRMFPAWQDKTHRFYMDVTLRRENGL